MQLPRQAAGNAEIICKDMGLWIGGPGCCSSACFPLSLNPWAACTAGPEFKYCYESHFTPLGYLRVFQQQTPHQPCRLEPTSLLRITSDVFFFPLLSGHPLWHCFIVDSERQFSKQKNRNWSKTGLPISETARVRKGDILRVSCRKFGAMFPFLLLFPCIWLWQKRTPGLPAA